MTLHWDANYAIARALIDHYPELNPADVGLVQLAELIEALPLFDDDPGLATERILTDIQITWFEEK